MFSGVYSGHKSPFNTWLIWSCLDLKTLTTYEQHLCNGYI